MNGKGGPSPEDLKGASHTEWVGRVEAGRRDQAPCDPEWTGSPQGKSRRRREGTRKK